MSFIKTDMLLKLVTIKIIYQLIPNEDLSEFPFQGFPMSYGR